MNELSLFDSLFNNTMDNVFDGYSYRTTMVPKEDVKETKDSYSLDMELPGRTENDVDIEIDRNTLTIASKKEEVKEENKKEKDGSKEKWLIKERRYSSFSRSFQLPEDVDSEGVKASFKNGILNIVMPRKALAAPKRIAIECA
ncbi:MAG: Hsp20/alpha crystallin family protein [Treponema sp.]|nr:Hsp20/alpha crystallin family protein [Treponema sp.]